MDEDKYAGFLGDRVLPVFFSGSAKENRRILCLLSYRIFHISFLLSRFQAKRNKSENNKEKRREKKSRNTAQKNYPSI